MRLWILSKFVSMNKMDPDQINTIVFGGGGLRGIAYLGALMAFQDLYKFEYSNVKTFAGTSVGSFVALMLACQFSVQDIQKIVSNLDMTVFKSDSKTRSTFLRQLVTTVLESKGLSKDTTMKDLYQKTERKLIVAVTNLNCASIQYLSHEECPECPVIDLVVGSMSLPFHFEPVS
jgi:predicted acylesterase/phospholipase RssA